MPARRSYDGDCDKCGHPNAKHFAHGTMGINMVFLCHVCGCRILIVG